MFRRLLVFAGLAVGLLAIAAAGLIVFRVALAEMLLSSQLASLGIPSADLRVAALDLRHMVVADLALGRDDELRVESVTLTYTPDELLDGRLENVTIEGLRLRLDLTGAGPPLGSLQPLLQKRQGAGAGGAGAMPAVVTLSRGRIEAAAVDGTMAAAISGQWEPLVGAATLSLSEIALPHVTLETSQLDVEAAGDRITVTAQAHGNQDALDLALRATVDAWRGDPIFALTLDGSLEPANWAIRPLPAVEKGRIAVSLQAEGRLPPVQAPPLDAAALGRLLGAELQGRLQVSLSDINYRDRAQGISGTLDLAAAVANGDLVVEVANEGRLRIARIDSAWLDAVGATAVTPLLRENDITIALPTVDAPLRARLRPTTDGAEVDVSGSVDMAMAETTLTVRADGVLALGKDYAVRRLSFPRADMHLSDLVVDGHRLDQLRISGTVNGIPRDLEGTADLTAELAATSIETLTAGPTKIGLTTEFDWAGQRLEFHQRGEGSLSVESLDLGKAARITRPTTFRLNDGMLAIDLTPDAPAFSHAITAWPKRVTVELPRPDDAPLAVKANAGAIRFEGSSGPDTPYRGQITLARASFAIPDHALSAEAVSATLTVPATVGKRLARFTVGRLIHGGVPAYFTPLKVDGEIVRKKDRFTLKATGIGADGGFRFSIRGHHRLADALGVLQVRVPETAFSKGALQPDQLSPLLNDIRETTGHIGATAEFAWGRNKVESKGALDLADISFVTDQAAVDGLNASISLDGLLPLSTPPGQEILIRRIDPAVPLDEVAVRFQVEPARLPRLRLEEATARFADGRLSIAEAIIDPSRPHNDLNVGVENIDLGLLLDLLQREDVTATGRLTGIVPLDISSAGVAINNGQLAAQGPGVLRVRSEAAASALSGAGEQVALMLSALEDFRYDALSATLDMGTDGDTAVMVRMQGHNPAVLDGYPFAFNTGLSGNLTELLGALRQGAKLSTDLVNPQLQ